MAERVWPRACGWYLDPEDPASLRYRDGDGWTSRRRPRPVWDLVSKPWPLPDPEDPDSDEPYYDGPVETAELPAIAAAVSSARDQMRSVPAGSGRVPAARRARMGGDGDGWLEYDVYETRPGRRRSFVVLILLSALAFAAMVTTVGIARPSVHNAWTLTDRNFINAANQDCAAALPAIRVTSLNAPSTVPNAKAIASLGRRLEGLQVASIDRSQVDQWLSAWQSYAQDVQTEAAQKQPDSQLILQGGTTETQADQFAVANDLGSCTLSANPDVAGAQPYS